jgi:hypothetical protein
MVIPPQLDPHILHMKCRPPTQDKKCTHLQIYLLPQYHVSHITCAAFFYYYSFIHMFIYCLGHFSPLSTSPNPFPLPPSVPGMSCSAFITSFVEEKRQP